MKKLIPLILIISLLFTSCQLKAEFVPDSTLNNIEQAEATTLSKQFFSLEDSFTASDFTDYFQATSTTNSTLASTNRFFYSQTNPHLPKTEIFTKKAAQNKSDTQTLTNPKTTAPTGTVKATVSAPMQKELRGVWISCYDHISAENKTKEQYSDLTDKMFKRIKDCGLNTAFIHLRAFSDAFYQSDIFPYSSLIAGKEGASLPFDPFEVMLESAKQYGISVHGWINPFRISTSTDISRLSEKNPAKKILDSGNLDGEICVLSNGIYYNPSCPSNHKLIIDGVREILNKYDIDGIHIDDYFYPSTSETVDKKQYAEYRADSGTLSLDDWRRNCINAFVSSLYSAVKTVNPSLTVSISPAARLDENYESNYADCELWLSHSGYADLIIPQIYFGFEHETLAFKPLLDKWSSLSRATGVNLACGIAANKCSTVDKYAGTGSEEWKNNSDILSRQVSTIRKNDNYCGFVVFSYQDLNRSNCKSEIDNFKKAITGTEQ